VSTDLKQPDQGRARPTPRARLGTWLAALAAAALLGGVALAVASGGRDARGWASVVVAVAAAAAVSAAAGARGAASRLVPKVQPAGGDLRPRVRELTSEIETVRAELDDRSRRGEEADRLKSLFIANMSHEIRTPLNSVLALTQLLREGVAGPLVPDQRRYLEVIERNGQNLLRLINDILDLSRIEAGRVEVDIQDLSLGPVVAEVVDSLEPLAHKKDLELAVRLPDPPPRVHVDVDRLRQILSLQRRLRDTGAHPRVRHSLVQRGIFREALVWLEVHGGAPNLVEDWRAFIAGMPNEPGASDGSGEGAGQPSSGEGFPFRRRRRRRRGRRRRSGSGQL